MRLKLLKYMAGGIWARAKGVARGFHASDPDMEGRVVRIPPKSNSGVAPSRLVAILAGSLGGWGMLIACHRGCTAGLYAGAAAFAQIGYAYTGARRKFE